MNDRFKRILELVRRTGDRMVVTDPDGDEAYVVMDLESYESLLGIAEDDGDFDLDGLDDDFPTESFPAQDSVPGDIWSAMKPAGEEGETWDLAKMGTSEQEALEQQFAAYQAKKSVDADKTADISEKETKESKEDEEDGFGEEQFYLEPVE